MTVHPDDPRCSGLSASADEPLAGTAPVAHAWIVVEHPQGWGDAPLARTGHGARVVMARGLRPEGPADDGPGQSRVWVGHGGRDPVLRRGLVDDPTEVAGWDLAAVAAGSRRSWGEPDEAPLLLVCANGRRDRCCGHAGRRLAERLWAGPWSSRVLTSTHLGGHRFAPTALLLPWGVVLGRVDADSATPVLHLAGAGRTPTHLLRGMSALSPPAQVAEVRARQVLGYDGLAPLDVRVESHPDGRALAWVGLPGRGLRVELVRTRPEVVASCGHAAEPVDRWTVAAIRSWAPPAA